MVGIIAIINCIYIYISEPKLVHANKVWINKVLLYCIRASGEFLTEGWQVFRRLTYYIIYLLFGGIYVHILLLI